MTGFYVALDQQYISKEEFDQIYERLNKQAAKTVALKNAINSR